MGSVEAAVLAAVVVLAQAGSVKSAADGGGTRRTVLRQHEPQVCGFDVGGAYFGCAVFPACY